MNNLRHLIPNVYFVFHKFINEQRQLRDHTTATTAHCCGTLCLFVSTHSICFPRLCESQESYNTKRKSMPTCEPEELTRLTAGMVYHCGNCKLRTLGWPTRCSTAALHQQGEPYGIVRRSRLLSYSPKWYSQPGWSYLLTDAGDAAPTLGVGAKAALTKVLVQNLLCRILVVLLSPLV